MFDFKPGRRTYVMVGVFVLVTVVQFAAHKFGVTEFDDGLDALKAVAAAGGLAYLRAAFGDKK